MQEQITKAFDPQSAVIILLLLSGLLYLATIVFKTMTKTNEKNLSKLDDMTKNSEKIFDKLSELIETIKDDKKTDQVDRNALINNYRQDLRDAVTAITTNTKIIDERIPKKNT